MAVKTKRISTLIESQLPEFISNEYELFGKFVEKYYESLEVQGGTLDIINNVQKYLDIDFYEKNLLKQTDVLASSISSSDTSIYLIDASSFPEKNGYIRIGNEIIFYATRTNNQLQNCSRGVSGNTTLGDLYDSSDFQSTEAASHISGEIVYNISNLFLYAFVRNFESQYLGSFPEKYLKGEVDKRTLIKNIQKFYKAKGTDSSIKFIFNTIVAKEADNKPSVYKPRDFTYKASEADWVSVYALKVKVISGNPKALIGKKIVQSPTSEYGYASATVDNVFADGTFDGEQIWNIVLAPETVNGAFSISTKTRLEKDLQASSGSGKRIDVFSTIGWDISGEVLINEEKISFSDKNITQFVIQSRGTTPVLHAEGSTVYKPVILEGSGISLLTLGVVYNLSPQDAHPYASVGDQIQVSQPGFETADPKIVLSGTNQTRWVVGDGDPVFTPTNTSISTALNEVSTDVSAIFEDEQYYYITSSSYPSYKILDGSTVTQEVKDQKILRIIRKEATKTTEVYKTPKRDVGILLNGVPIYSFRDEESIRFGILESIAVDNQGTGYVNPPFVLLDDVPNQARAVLSGQVVERIIVDTTTVFPRTPEVTITSGRGAVVRAVVTGGKVTSLIIDNPGEYYSSPPIVRIRDNAGRGRFADYTAIVNTDGNITGFIKNDEGNFYNQSTVIVDIIPVGSGASGIPYLKEWNKNRFTKLANTLDTEYGYVFENYNQALKYGYGHVGNPKALRVLLNDNLNGAGTEPTTKTHSPIIGFAYDGNPIYGPFGYQDPLNSQSSIVRMTSSYSLNNNRQKGPSTSTYPLGTFVNDYRYVHKSGTLDQNNGRFCVTPDYPNGTYAYFLTVDSNQVPQFPYFIGENFYSLPVDSNYNSDINQNDIPKKSRRLFSPGMPRNGEGVIAQIAEVRPGVVDSVSIENSSNNFSVNSKLYFDNSGTEGQDAEVIVSSVNGKTVNYLQSKETKVVQLTTIQSAYLFANDTLRQPASGAYGEIVGTVTNDNTIVLKNVSGTFNTTGTFSADIKTFSILIDQDSNYTKGAILSLTDGINTPIATGEVLEGTSRQNVVKIKVLTGTWVVNDDYFIQSNDLFNTSGSRIITLTSLSDNLEPFDINQNVALIETAQEHGLGIGDQINVNIFPNDATKTKTYYLRKRLYQTVKFISPDYTSNINYTGVGRFEIFNGGADYTPGTYTNVSLTGGSGSGATATIIVSSAGVVSSVVIQNGGSGYKKADYLSVDDEDLVRSLGSLGNARLVLYIDHVGFAAGSTSLIVDSAIGVSNGDLLKIGNEIVQVSSITNNRITVIRAREGTQNIDHYDGQEVSLYKPRYNFANNYQISSSSFSGFIKSYDPNTQEAVIVFNYSTEKTNAEDVKISTNFFDSSTPAKLVSVETANVVEYKFEFSTDNVNFVSNPNIDIQEYYKYKFDTSHSSLTGTYFDLSPSKNYNIVTEEKITTTILPGNPGSFTDVKFGFGPRLSANSYSQKIQTQFANFYYFDKNQIINSDGKYLKIISDPLQGNKTITYVTPNRFVYQLSSIPLWDGSGSITYTTTGQFAIGTINSFSVINSGLNYKKSPIIVGCDPTTSFKAEATVLFDQTTKTITGVRIDNEGSNYYNPKVVITNGDGINAQFNIIVRQGRIFSITVDNPGKNYTFAPEIEIVEGNIQAYVNSNSIGVPQSISIIQNGGAFHLDKTVSSDFTSKTVFSLTNFSGEFQRGELVVQKISGVEVARGRVSEWRPGSNLLKVENITGIFRTGYTISSIDAISYGTIKSIFVTELSPEITSFYNNLGYYGSDKGKLGVANQKLLDSDFYQDYSYVIKSKTPIDQWRELIKSTTHPAGFKLFGQVDVETNSSTSMPQQAAKSGHFSIIQLWDPEKNVITIENTRRILTQTIQKVENQRIRRGFGSASPSEFNFSEYRAFTVSLAQAFNGYYDSDGRLQGRTVFQVRDANGVPFSPISAKSLIITLDGILQEPEVAYTVQGDTIVFSKPPLGPGTERTGNDLNDLTSYRGVTFYGKYFAFKDNQYNTRYLRKIRNIYQRSGRWLDAANQIERNRTFIIEEVIGYGKAKYPALDWSSKIDDYQEDIGYILDAYQHDIRFGGNVKTIDYVNIFNNNSEYEYITKNKVSSVDIFRYTTNLATLAMRNWDIVESNVVYNLGSTTITIGDTNRVAVGMYVSCGRAFPSNTRITAITSATQVTVSNAALASSASDQITFYLSGINNGTFYDASNLIQANKAYLQDEIGEYIYDNYTLPPTDKQKCKRDLGYLIDAITYHLKFGGNRKVVEFARSYYTNAGYPYGEELTYINRSVEETTAAIDAWENLGSLMIAAMRNQLTAGAYTSISPVIDNTVLTDPISPVCQEVASSINTMIDIVKEIIADGAGSVEITEVNQNKTGYWSNTETYSNYNLIDDPLLLSQECNDVASSLNSLYLNVKDILDKKTVTRSLPDYVDGENKVFDLYWENGDEVITDEDEDLFLTINAVLQRPKYTEDYPRFDSYYIKRDVIPNQLVFDVAPIWDQDFSAKSIGEPTAVEKVVGIGVGNYKRLTIDYNLVDGTRSGPFLILDVEDLTVQNIEEPEFLYVFLDGVLQREGYSYTISGPNIFFNVPILEEMKIDMRYLYGRDIGQVLNIYDFNPDSYYAKSKVSLQVTNGLLQFINYGWMGDKIGSPIHAYQMNGDGTYKMIGEISNVYVNGGSTLEFDVFGNKYEIDEDEDIGFAVSGFYNLNTSISISNATVVFEKDDNNRLLLSDLNQIWSGTVLGKTYKKPFVFLSNNDLIRIDGEDTFRKIKRLPGITTSKENRSNQQVSNSLYGTVDVETYNGVTRGEGLSVVAKIENGKVIDLEWNQRSYDPLTQPTAYQYYIPPVLNFISLDGNGGGARANVLVSKGQVISVDLIDGGSGYTKAPKVVVSRGYDLLTERDIGVSLINVGVNSFVELQSLTIVSIVDALGNQVSGVNSFTSIFFDSPISSDRVITAIVQLVRNTGDNLSREHIEFLDTVEPALDEVKIVTVSEEPTLIIAQIQDIVSNTTISTNRQITTTFENLIPNDALSNVNYYATGAYLDVDLGVSDNIVYVADTSKFKTNGYLLIGDEIVRYYRKLTDRFLKVQRGQSNTIAKSWTAGTFLRQIPDPVSIVFGGVSVVESQSQVVTVKGGTSEIQGIEERKTQFQIITPSTSITTTSICIVAELQPEISIESISSIFISGGNRIIEAGSTNIVSGFDLRYSATELRGEIKKEGIQLSEFLVSEKLVNISVSPFVYYNSVVTTTSTHQSEVATQVFSIINSIVDTEFNASITIQSIHTELSQLYINQTEVLIIPPPTGAVDGYEESSLLSDPIFTRSNGFVELDDINGQYFVGRRSLSDILIRNVLFGSGTNYIGTYEKTNVGHRISHFSGIFDDGYARVSGISIQELDTYYPSLTLQDFVDRANSSYTLSGDYFNLLPPSIQNPVAVPFSTGSIASTIEVPTTTFFPTSGYLYTENGGLIQYTGKTSTSFTGCTFVRGSTALLGNSVIFDGTGDYLNIASNSAFNYGTGDFTIEFYWRPNALSGTQVLIDQRTASTDVSIYVEMNSTGNIRVFVNGSYRITSSNTCSTSQFNHVAIYRSSGTTRVAINGTVTTASTYTDANNYASKPFRIGASWTAGSPISGRINSLRVVKGTSLYAGTNFTVPSQITNISGTSLLTCQGNSIRDRSSNNLSISVVGDAAVSNTGTTIIPFQIT
jgi:hypothetical protein